MSWSDAYATIIDTIRKRSKTQNDILKDLVDRGWIIEASDNEKIILHGQGWVTIDLKKQIVEFATSSCWHDFTVEELLSFAEILKLGKKVKDE